SIVRIRFAFLLLRPDLSGDPSSVRDASPYLFWCCSVYLMFLPYYPLYSYMPVFLLTNSCMFLHPAFIRLLEDSS
uniref:Uncharacterized protein n=1 Tax=Aegilops tauschii subsp. strangulata TaxID=200361 RepID=A0A453S6Z8_AEGTS